MRHSDGEECAGTLLASPRCSCPLGELTPLVAEHMAVFSVPGLFGLGVLGAACSVAVKVSILALALMGPVLSQGGSPYVCANW